MKRSLGYACADAFCRHLRGRAIGRLRKISEARANAARGAMFIVELCLLPVFCFSAARRADVQSDADRGPTAAPLKNKRGSGLVLVSYKHVTPTGLGQLRESRSDMRLANLWVATTANKRASVAVGLERSDDAGR